MRSWRILMVLCAVACMVVAACGQRDESKPPAETGKGEVPAERLAELEKLLGPLPSGLDRDQARDVLIQRMEKVLELGMLLERSHGEAANVHEVRSMMLRAAEQLVSLKRDEASSRRLLEIAGTIVSSQAPAPAKVRADYYLTRNAIAERAASPQDAAKRIMEFLGRYEQSAAADDATISAAILAANNKLNDLYERLVEKLKASYADSPRVRRYLSIVGRMEGVAFQARLNRLDGRELVLPDDLMGKVVVVEFWATWCPPCVAASGHMRQLYERFKDRGLEVVGISLDYSRKALEDFVRQERLAWIHTFTGKGWDDPTVQQYGVRQTPTIWVIGRDGKVISDAAMDPAAQTLEQALAPLDRIVDQAVAAPTAEGKR